MRSPYIQESRADREVVDNFRGYNNNLRIGQNEFFYTENMTTDYAPVASPRGPRGLYAEPAASIQSIQGMIEKDALCYVDGSKLVINRKPIEMGLSVLPEDNPKQLIGMGAYIIIMPDAKWINTADLTDTGDINVDNTAPGPISFEMCDRDGNLVEAAYVQAEQPTENVKNGEYWIDTSGKKHALKVYSASTTVWVAVVSTYVKISAPGIGAGLKEYDGIRLVGLDGTLHTAPDAELVGTAAEQIKALSGWAILYKADPDNLVIPGILDGKVTITDTIHATRQMPYMDYITESGNRLWGCRYGLSREGEVVNEIYASKLGDFRNWRCYMGISTDSYTASVGTDGPFTGAVTMDYPIFWKETCLHKMYGTQPSNFKLQVTKCRGIQMDCYKSAAIVNEVLYYKAPHAICAYNGSLPVEVSGALGDRAYRKAVGGALGNKYYVSMQDVTTGEWNLFVFDTAQRVWIREDGLRADDLCAVDQELYALDHYTGNIITLRGSGERIEDQVTWSAESGDIGLDTPDTKRVQSLTIRMAMPSSTLARVSIGYRDGGWETVAAIRGRGLKSFPIRIRPRRCDHFRIRIDGIGEAKIYSIAKKIVHGREAP